MTTIQPRIRRVHRLRVRTRRVHRAFTLIELLVVISIIGALMALTATAIQGVITKAANTAIKMDINLTETALESYSLKYGDYPPDFSDWTKVERHFRKAFPEINDEELKILAQFTHLNSSFRRVPVVSSGSATLDPRGDSSYAHYRQCIDSAEALVFCLGGFSSDSKRPFTGAGGPLAFVAGASVTTGDRGYYHYQYNSTRENHDFDFSNGLMSIFVAKDPADTSTANPLGIASTGPAYSYSSDEYEAGNPAANSSGSPPVRGDYTQRATGTPLAAVRFLVDPFPVYRKDADSSPTVYFESSTYKTTFIPKTVSGGWLPSGAGWHNLNYYAHPDGDSDNGFARPYLSAQANTNAGGFLWAADGKYQVISAGQDLSYGGLIAAGVVDPSNPATFSNAGVVSQFPTGSSVNAGGVIASGSDKYEDNDFYEPSTPQLDNITSFSGSTFKDDLE